MKPIYEQYQRLCRELVRNREQELRIGMITTDYVDFPVLRAFEQEYPQYSLYFSFGSEEKLAEELSAGRLDALICPDILRVDKRIWEKKPMGRVPVLLAETVLVCSKEVLARLGSIEKVIESQPLITKTEGTGYHDFCRRELEKIYGVSFPEAIAVKGLSQQLLMVNMANGFAVIPKKSRIEAGDLAFFPLPEVFDEVSELLYPSENTPEPLERLVRYIHEKKC